MAHHSIAPPPPVAGLQKHSIILNLNWNCCKMFISPAFGGGYNKSNFCDVHKFNILDALFHFKAGGQRVCRVDGGQAGD